MEDIYYISYKMTMSARFYLSYNFIKKYFIPFKMNVISRSLSVTLHIRAKMLLHVRSYDCYDSTLSTEKQRRNMINHITSFYVDLMLFWIEDRLKSSLQNIHLCLKRHE